MAKKLVKWLSRARGLGNRILSWRRLLAEFLEFWFICTFVDDLGAQSCSELTKFTGDMRCGTSVVLQRRGLTAERWGERGVGVRQWGTLASGHWAVARPCPRRSGGTGRQRTTYMPCATALRTALPGISTAETWQLGPAWSRAGAALGQLSSLLPEGRDTSGLCSIPRLRVSQLSCAVREGSSLCALCTFCLISGTGCRQLAADAVFLQYNALLMQLREQTPLKSMEALLTRMCFPGVV